VIENFSSPPIARPRAGWSLGDMVVVVVLSLVGTVLMALLFGLGIRALGFGNTQALLLSHPVAATAVSGTAIYGILLLTVYGYIVRRRGLGWSALGFRRPPLLALLLAPVIVFGQLVAAALMNLLVFNLMGSFENPQVEGITGGQSFSWLNFGLMLVLAGVVAPIVEEIFFRGLVYGWLRSRAPLFVAVLLSAAIFAVAHVVPILIPALFVVGIILALAYELSGSLWLSILLHGLQNSLAVTLIFVLLALDLPLNT